MTERLTFADLLQIEADPKLWSFVCPVSGVPYWHLIRVPVMRMIISDEFYDQGIVPASSSPVPPARMFKTALRSVAHNLVARPTPSPILVMATAGGMIKIDDVWVNRLADHFVNADPTATILIEDQFQWQWRTPRAVRATLFHAPLQAHCVLRASMQSRAPYRKAARQVVAMAARRATETVGRRLDEQRICALTNRLTARASELPHLYRAYKRLLGRLGTRILLKEEASYGGSSALMAAANSLGIVTAEYQHGVISRGHDAYNFAAAIQHLPALKQCLPQYLLTYGDWWGQQLSSSVTPVSIGNPHRSYALDRLAPAATRPDAVLFLGDGLDTDASLTMARQIANAIGPANLRLIFRPHPIERDRIAELAGQNRVGVEIDTVADINSAMFGVAAVVGEVSTGLFEAYGLAQRVLMWNTPKAGFRLRSHPFETFASANELAMRLTRDPPAQHDQTLSMLWASEWRHRYAAFLSSHGVTNPGDGHE